LILTDMADPALGRIAPAAWYVATDRVMGGVSAASLVVGERLGRPALLFTGQVSLANNGGFALVGCRFSPPLDACGWRGVALTLVGTGFGYALSVRNADTRAPWETYLADLPVPDAWTRVEIGFDRLSGNRPLPPFDKATISRIAISARARAFDADLAVTRVELYS
jgi:hypothetical protein